MRLFEQRLFIKLDEKRPNAMKRMSAFLKTIHKRFTDELQLLENAKENLKKYSSFHFQYYRFVFKFSVFGRSEINLSCALAVITHLIRFFDMPPKVLDSLLVTLMCPVVDYPQQVSMHWNAMI